MSWQNRDDICMEVTYHGSFSACAAWLQVICTRIASSSLCARRSHRPCHGERFAGSGACMDHGCEVRNKQQTQGLGTSSGSKGNNFDNGSKNVVSNDDVPVLSAYRQVYMWV
jgi:hypothetical protein